MAVPNTNEFSLNDVRAELGLASNTSLSACFSASVDSKFDSDHKGAKNSLLNFRNYGAVTAYLTVSPASMSVGYRSTAGFFSINSSSSCSITDNSSWITLSSSSAPSGSSSRAAYFEQNTSPFSRSGAIIVKNGSISRAIYVTQFEYCLVEGTKITMADGSTKKIEELLKGDLLASPVINGFKDSNTAKILEWRAKDLNLEEVKGQVVGNQRIENQEIVSINNGLLEATAEHVHFFKRNGTWRFGQIKTIKIGDLVMDRDKNEIKVGSVITLKERKTVFKLSLREPNHIFYANGIITHNVKPIQ